MVFTLEQQIDNLNFDKGEKLAEDLERLPPNATEAIVDINFIASSFLRSLGFSLQEQIPQFNTHNNTRPVDYALRNNTEDDIFNHTQANPSVLVELKGRTINLKPGSNYYKTTVKQFKKYLLGNNCKSAQWGIITNSKQIQLFRKHEKVILPATPCLEINPKNVSEITCKIRKKNEQNHRALTVAVYNNKGGVGKQVFYLTPQAMPDDIKDPKVLNTLSIAELKKVAEKRNLSGYSKFNKTKLVDLLSN